MDIKFGYFILFLSFELRMNCGHIADNLRKMNIKQSPCQMQFLTLPKKLNMNSTKWKQVKKDLPGNWAVQVSKSLSDKGFTITNRQVSDLMRGKVKDTDTVKKVLQEIKLLKSRHKRKKMSLKKIL